MDVYLPNTAQKVPYEQSLFLLDALKKAGVKAELYTAKGGTHSNIK